MIPVGAALLTREASRAIDRAAIDAGVPGVILMENAGRGAADALLARFGDRLGRVVIVGGTGQNGGDAWVIARRLIAHGVRSRAWLAGARDRVEGDARINLRALEAVGGAAEELGEGGAAEALEGATLIVDGLFGTGLDRPIEGWRRALVEAMAASDAPVVALDLPSGIDADTGAVLGAVAPAAMTVTFAAHKRGLWQGAGRAAAGDVVCVDIGVPPPPAHDRLLSLSDAARGLPARRWDAHKGTAGHVLVLGGSAGKTGAARLSARGALRGGAGLVTIAIDAAGQAGLDAAVLEVMTAPLGDDPEADARALAEGKGACVLGPGFGLAADRRALALALARSLPTPTVLDADALTALADVGLEALQGAPRRVLTPHPGEAGRLLGVSAAEVQADRYAAAAAIAERSGQVAVLKGAGTIVAEPGRLAVCPLGHPALGVAGTGDVLAGAIAAALAAGGPAFEAACAAVLLHAHAGELAARADRGLLASEVADRLPDALHAARLTR